MKMLKQLMSRFTNLKARMRASYENGHEQGTNTFINLLRATSLPEGFVRDVEDRVRHGKNGR